jgi:hypothetical protein
MRNFIMRVRSVVNPSVSVVKPSVVILTVVAAIYLIEEEVSFVGPEEGVRVLLQGRLPGLEPATRDVDNQPVVIGLLVSKFFCFFSVKEQIS